MRSSTGSAASSSSSRDALTGDADEPLDRTGRDGLLDVAFVRRGGRTVLARRRFRLPLQTLEPLDLEDDAATLVLLNPTGGIVGGDRLRTEIELGPDSHVCVTTPSATRVYRTTGPAAVSLTTIRVGERGVLEFVPDHVIPSPGARLHQSTTVELGAGAQAIVVDAWATGRAARAEAWQFAELDLALSVRDPAGPVLLERARLGGAGASADGDRTPWTRPDALGFAEGHPYVATIALLGAGAGGWDDLAVELQLAFDAVAGGRYGVSPLARAGVAARVLAPSAPVLEDAVAVAWSLWRRRRLGRPPLPLRKL
jgi:urease accessory protein